MTVAHLPDASTAPRPPRRARSEPVHGAVDAGHRRRHHVGALAHGRLRRVVQGDAAGVAGDAEEPDGLAGRGLSFDERAPAAGVVVPVAGNLPVEGEVSARGRAAVPAPCFGETPKNDLRVLPCSPGLATRCALAVSPPAPTPAQEVLIDVGPRQRGAARARLRKSDETALSVR